MTLRREAFIPRMLHLLMFSVVDMAVSTKNPTHSLSTLTFFLFGRQLNKHPRGSDLMNHISDKIKSGARAFLITEYKYLTGFVIAMFAALVILYTIDPPSNDKTDGIRYGGSFLFGAFLSALAGWGGMVVATDANVRTTQAADEKGLAVALRVAFTGGAVMGFTVVGLGLLGLSVMYLAISYGYDDDATNGDRLEARLTYAADAITGFGFGASSIALFARVAGGIYTKAADVGADLVGKVEMDIPEDDPRNPAVVADNVGDNVGDVAGMGADLFESFVSALLVAPTADFVLTTHIISTVCYRLDPSLLQSHWLMETLPSSCCPFGLLVLVLSRPSLAFSPLVQRMEPDKKN